MSYCVWVVLCADGKEIEVEAPSRSTAWAVVDEMGLEVDAIWEACGQTFQQE